MGFYSSSTAPSGGTSSVHSAITRRQHFHDVSANASASKYSTDAIKVKAYSSADDIAADPELDVIAVSVNIRHHLDLSKKVIAAGKTLFVEWPAGVGLKETKILAGLAEEKGIRSIVGLQARQGLLFRKVKAIIESGKIGDVLSTSMVRIFPWYSGTVALIIPR